MLASYIKDENTRKNNNVGTCSKLFLRFIVKSIVCTFILFHFVIIFMVFKKKTLEINKEFWKRIRA